MRKKIVANGQDLVRLGLRESVRAVVPFSTPVISWKDHKTYELKTIEQTLSGFPEYKKLLDFQAVNGFVTRDFMLSALAALFKRPDLMSNRDFCKALNEVMTCSLTQERVDSPVTVIGTGQTYEHKAIERWFEDHHADPNTQLVLTESQRVLIHNELLQRVSRILNLYEHSPVGVSFTVAPVITETQVPVSGIYRVLPLNYSQFLIGSFLYAYLGTLSGSDIRDVRVIRDRDSKTDDGEPHGGEVKGLCALGGSDVLTVSYAFCAKRWQMMAEALVKVAEISFDSKRNVMVHAIASIHNHTQLVFSTGRADLVVWDLSTCKAIRQIVDTDASSSSDLIPLEDGYVLRKGFFNVTLWDVDSGRLIQELKEFKDSEQICSVSYLGSERGIVAGISTGNIIFYQRHAAASPYFESGRFKTGADSVSQVVALEAPCFASLSYRSDKPDTVCLQIWNETHIGDQPVNRILLKGTPKSVLTYLGEGRLLLVTGYDESSSVSVISFRI